MQTESSRRVFACPSLLQSLLTKMTKSDAAPESQDVAPPASNATSNVEASQPADEPKDLSAGDTPQAAPPQEAQKGPIKKVRLERRQELEHKLKSNPTDLEGFLELAAIYREEDRPLEAKRLLKQAIKIFPDEEQIRWQLEEATLARSLQQFREVRDLAARLNTADADRELERSRSDWAMRRIEVCHARLERDPSQTSLRMALAEAKFDAEIFEDAFDEAGQLLESDEFSPYAHFLRAKCLLALNKDLAAMKELRSVALRRAVVAPTKLRQASLKILCELSEKQSLEATHQHYKLLMEQLEESSPDEAIKETS